MDALASARGKVRHGNRHIDALDRILEDYLQAAPIDLAVEDVPDTDRRQVVVRDVRKPIPEDAPFLLGDAVHNLRSALDHLIHHVAPGFPDASFPVGKAATKPDMKQLVNTSLKGAPRPILRALYSLQPYPGGQHEAVWFLHHLDIADKHRALVVMVDCFSGLVVDPAARMRQYLASLDDPPVSPEDICSVPLVLRPEDTEVAVGKVLYVVPASAVIDERFEFTVALKEPQIPAGRPVTNMLRSWSAQVAELLDELAALRPA